MTTGKLNNFSEVNKSYDISEIAQDIKNIIEDISNLKIKQQLLDNLNYHVELHKEVKKILSATSNLSHHNDEFLSIKKLWQIICIKLQKSEKDLIVMLKENYIAMLKAKFILDVLLKCENLEEGLKGGHFVIKDRGEFYKQVKEIFTYNQRISSHYSEQKKDGRVNKKSDCAIQAGWIFNEFLFGITKIKSKEEQNEILEATWFQIEAAPVIRVNFIESRIYKIFNDILQVLTKICSLGIFKINIEPSINTLKHAISWVNYAIIHKKQRNISQYGCSQHTEKYQPIVIDGQINLDADLYKLDNKEKKLEVVNVLSHY